MTTNKMFKGFDLAMGKPYTSQIQKIFNDTDLICF